MIERYSRPEMTGIWTEDAKYQYWGKVERAHLATLCKGGEIPGELLASFDRALCSKNTAFFLAREQETGHDVIAFVAEVGEAMGAYGSHLHKGLTSSDVVDTAMALRINDSLDVLRSQTDALRVAFAKQAFAHSKTMCMGRTHGIFAEPLSFGQVLASHFAEVQRAHTALCGVRMLYGKLSGAVGHYSQLTPEFEANVLSHLGLQPEPIATQVIPRDRILRVVHACVSLSNAIERFALNVRHWARSDLNEVLEPFGARQKGSSAMPHKRNPILSENLCGLAKIIRGYATAMGESTALWHERDISHSSVERFVLPDMFVTLDFMTHRCAFLVENMQVRPEFMQRTLQRSKGLWASQSVLTALTATGMPRTQAYELVQSVALPVANALQDLSFRAALEQDTRIPKLDFEQLFDQSRFMAHLPAVFQRVFGCSPHGFDQENSLYSIPALKRIYKVTVSLKSDILDTESKTICDFLKQENSVLELGVTRSKSYCVSVPINSAVSIQESLRSTLQNDVMEDCSIEIVQ